MPNHPTSNPAQFIQGAPALHVPDVKATANPNPTINLPIQAADLSF
jgi:hypothetical protein